MSDEFIAMSRVFQNGDTVQVIMSLEFRDNKFVIKNQFAKLNKQGAIKASDFKKKKQEKAVEKAKQTQQEKLDSFSNIDVQEEGF